MDNNYLLELYLKGQLSPEQKEYFREQLKTDKTLRNQVLAEALMIKNMKQQTQEKEKAILEEVKKELPAAASARPAASRARASRRWTSWISSIAALFIIAFFAAKPVYFSYKSNQMMSQNYVQWTPRADGASKGASRGEVQAGENVVAELSELFDNVGKGKDMKMTIYRLEKALQESNTDYEYNQYSDDIVWYLALAYIQNNQFGKARTELLKIIESGDPYYLERAENLYKEIENMYFM